MKSTEKKATISAIRSDILRSAIASFCIEKITISTEQAAIALRKAETTLGK
ncbi:hypothetical protein [Spirosoma sp. KCTC 42546]|uniref:hypothetical protein n=1 Tax=Spirosoma sp. KCTC 42546 TaxID=2520506 RepID=UPI00143E089B|nr:hypothetical protein [Spirosoma sp. KCTC 42546]